MTDGWALAALGLLGLAHLAMLAYALRLSGGGAGSSEEAYVTDEGVECSECGELNDTDFRYCRRCVSELPTGVSLVRDSTGPRSRRTM